MTFYGTWMFKGKQRETKTQIYVIDAKEKRRKGETKLRKVVRKSLQVRKKDISKCTIRDWL